MTPTPTNYLTEREEKVAMNIVYQLGDVLEATVEKRQSTNDKAIDFVKKLVTETATTHTNLTLDSAIASLEKMKLVCGFPETCKECKRHNQALDQSIILLKSLKSV